VAILEVKTTKAPIVVVVVVAVAVAVAVVAE